MPRLSIVVFCFERTDLLEETLVTVLQHRPADSEVLVVHDGRYDDPYALGDEVRFLEVEPLTTMAHCANRALAESTGLVVHFLAGGVKVGPNWADSALDFFEDPNVGAVAPVLLDGRREDTVACIGISTNWLLNRVLVGHGKKSERASLDRLGSSAPNLVASFYRRSQLASLGGFRTEFGDELADADAGLRLAAVGVELVSDVDCELTVAQWDRPPRESAIERGRFHQRFLAAHRSEVGGLRYQLSSGINGLLEILTSPRSPSRLAMAWGRLGEWRGTTSHQLAAAEEETAPSRQVLSIDRAREEKAGGGTLVHGGERRAA